jgi:tetratricopeptide (TPR) repeat protein
MRDPVPAALLFLMVAGSAGCGAVQPGPASSPGALSRDPTPGEETALVGPPMPEAPVGPPAVAAAPADGLSEDAERLLEHATLILEAIDAGSYSMAAEETQRMSAAFPGSRDSWLIQILLERRLAQLQSGASASLTASKQEAQARGLIKQGRKEEARLLLERAHALDPRNAGVVESLVSVLKQMGLERYGAGDAVQAAALWRRAVEIRPTDEEARRFLKRADDVKKKI